MESRYCCAVYPTSSFPPNATLLQLEQKRMERESPLPGRLILHEIARILYAFHALFILFTAFGTFHIFILLEFVNKLSH